MKSNSIGLSFGYLAESIDGGNGTRLLTSVDLLKSASLPRR